MDNKTTARCRRGRRHLHGSREVRLGGGGARGRESGGWATPIVQREGEESENQTWSHRRTSSRKPRRPYSAFSSLHLTSSLPPLFFPGDRAAMAMERCRCRPPRRRIRSRPGPPRLDVRHFPTVPRALPPSSCISIGSRAPPLNLKRARGG